MNKFSKLRAGVAPAAIGLALIAMPAFAQDATAPQDSSDAETAANEPAIIVTGTRIQSPNVTATAPVTTVTNLDLKLSGAQRTEDLLNSLPQVFAAQSSTLSNGATGTATVDLRGLGSQRTLVLINGRRLMTGDPNSTSSAADLNFIPAALVKRVDVLTGGASATYGADAVAGVVNFVMDSDFTGLRIDSNYAFYQHNNRNSLIRPLLDARAATTPGYGYPKGSVADGGQFDGTISFGTKFDDDRGHMMAYFGYRRADPVLQRNRDYSACTLQNSGAALSSPTRLNPAAPLLCGGSATAKNAVIFAHYSSTSNSVVTSSGTTSTLAALGNGTITPFSANRYNFAPLNYFQRPDERYTAGAFADYEISPALHPYMEFMFMDDRTVAQIAPSGDFGNTLQVNCDNPLMTQQQHDNICADLNLVVGYVGNYPLVASNWNKAFPNTPVPGPVDFIDPTTGNTYNRAFFQLLRRNVEGGPRINDLQHTAYRGVLGMKGDLGSAWSYDAYYQYGRTNYSQVYKNEFSTARLNRALDVVDGPNGPVCRSALDGTDPNCTPYNVFTGDPSAASVAYLSSTGFIKGMTSEQVLSANLTGQLGEYGVKSPWSDDGVSISLGGEYRKESLELEPDEAFTSGDLTGQGAPTLPVSGSYKVTEFISEIDVPIVQDHGIYALSFNGGYRYSHYSVSNGNHFNTDTYKLGLDFAPVRDIRFRASYNRAVRAPNIQELFAPQFVGLDGSTDPCAGRTLDATKASDAGCLLQGLHDGDRVTANPAAQYNGLLGGNPNLKPERATTKTLGAVIQPRWIPNLTLSVDWFDIKIKDAIQGFGSDAILSACTNDLNAAACSLIHRDTAGSLWLTSAGYVEDLSSNVGGFRTRGIEFNGNYSHEVGSLGTVSFNFVGTALDKYEIDNGLTAVYNCAGYYGPTCGGPAPKWRHKARVSFNTKAGLGLSLQWRYMGPVDIEYKNPSSTLSGNYYDFGSRLGAQSYFDLAMTANLGNHVAWRLGVNNLFDKQPPLVTSGSGRFGASACASVVCNGNTYPGTYDSLGRFIYTGVTLDF